MKVLSALLFLALAFPLAAQEPATKPAKLRVLVKPAEPFAFEKNGQLDGYSVDLWRRVAQDAGLEYETKLVNTLPEALTALQKGEADVGVGAISVTEERETVLDFSHPFFESGLQILALGKSNGSAFRAFRSLFSGDVFKVIGLLLLALFAISNLLWFFERGRTPDFPESYPRGLWESVWWSVSIIITGGCENKTPTGVPGRLVAIVWMLGGIGLTSYITATLASAMTVNTLNSEIHGVADLQGKSIGTVSGTSAEAYLKIADLSPQGFPDVNAAVEALIKGDLKAVVYDSPILRYYLSNHPTTALKLSGPVFEKQNYGFALPLGSPLRKRINEALLKLQLEDFPDELEKKWFSVVKDD